MGSNAFLGSKTKFYISDFEHGPYTLLAEVLGVEGLSLIRDVPEVTHLNVTNKYRSHIGGFRDPGSVNLNLNFTHDTYVILMDHFEDDDFKWYRIELPNFERTIFQFKGLMINCPVVIRTTESVTCNSSIKLSGAPFFTVPYLVDYNGAYLVDYNGAMLF